MNHSKYEYSEGYKILKTEGDFLDKFKKDNELSNGGL